MTLDSLKFASKLQHCAVKSNTDLHDSYMKKSEYSPAVLEAGICNDIPDVLHSAPLGRARLTGFLPMTETWS
jgi:hypothetical protein